MEVLTIQPHTEAAANKFRERRIVSVICLLSAIHVFVFSAAFPFFNDVDEPAHFDLVLKYARGQAPKGPAAFSRDSSGYLAIFGSDEYWTTTEMVKEGKLPPPVWKEPAKQAQRDVAAALPVWQMRGNYEVSMPPLYYVLAAVWWHLGQWLGFSNGGLLYWLRFLNIPLVAGAVWLGYISARLIFPENIFIRLGVPTLMAIMPQSVFYSVGNDVLSPLCFGLVFICLIRWMRMEHPTAKLGAATGLALAATYLAKTTNLPLLAVAGAVICFSASSRLLKHDASKRTLTALAALAGSAVPPIAGWAIWCKIYFGDFTGSKLKANYFGWTVKPLHEWLHHPIFSPQGLWTYLSGQLATYWHGEISWHNQPTATPMINALFTVLSLTFLLIAVIRLARLPAGTDTVCRGALWSGFACFVVGLGFFAFMSIVYDFHNCPNPSREHPYFAAGRMLLGSLIPFQLLLVFGVEGAGQKWGSMAKYATFTILITLILTWEIVRYWTVFSSQYNWYHL